MDITEQPPAAGEIKQDAPFPTLREQGEQLRLKVLFLKSGVGEAGDYDFDFYSPKTRAFAGTHQHALATDLITLGLSAEVETIERPPEGMLPTVRVRFARDAEGLQKMKALQASNPADFDHTAFGELYGIPRTAIEAWPDGILYDPEVPTDISEHPLFQAKPFVLSRSHFREEWQAFVDQAEAVRRDMPELVSALDLGALYEQGQTYQA